MNRIDPLITAAWVGIGIALAAFWLCVALAFSALV